MCVGGLQSIIDWHPLLLLEEEEDYDNRITTSVYEGSIHSPHFERIKKQRVVVGGGDLLTALTRTGWRINKHYHR